MAPDGSLHAMVDTAPSWGQLGRDEMDRIVVVSPHFDDAAMGAGLMLLRHAGRSATSVVTVFAGWPPAYPDPPSPWDALGGFEAGDDVVAARRLEDAAAMEVLGATPVWLEFSDHQYLPRKERATPAEVAVALEKALSDADPTAVFIPMGLANPDHVTAHEAGLLRGPGLQAPPRAAGLAGGQAAQVRRLADPCACPDR
jgi:LmbE family N-acetylglucosaminyl deacetylase